MSFKKFGSGEVTGTEGTEALAKTAAAEEWMPEDDAALAEESATGAPAEPQNGSVGECG
jgi:hypothetical protein